MSKAFQYQRFGSGARSTSVARIMRWNGAPVMLTLSSATGNKRYIAQSAIRTHDAGTTVSNRPLRK